MFTFRALGLRFVLRRAPTFFAAGPATNSKSRFAARRENFAMVIFEFRQLTIEMGEHFPRQI